MQLFIWNNVRVTFQSKNKNVKIKAESVDEARAKWQNFVKNNNFYEVDLDDFYYDTWYSNAIDVNHHLEVRDFFNTEPEVVVE